MSYVDLARDLLVLVQMLFSKKKDDRMETSISKLKLLISAGNCEEIFRPAIPQIIRFSMDKRVELLQKSIDAFNYVPEQLRGNPSVFEEFPKLAAEYSELFSEEERKLFWRKLYSFLRRAAELAL